MMEGSLQREVVRAQRKGALAAPPQPSWHHAYAWVGYRAYTLRFYHHPHGEMRTPGWKVVLSKNQGLFQLPHTIGWRQER